jgi:arylsulfate sulfotransferase
VTGGIIMKRNYKIATILSVAFIMVSTLFILNQKATNHNELTEKVSMVDNEYEIEKKFKVNGYTLDNPNIILNPYGNSPLTALVLFETEQEFDAKVTITGKDKLTTYTHTFSKTKEHYLPIYGLYADSNNKIIIECGNNKKEIYIQTEKLPENMILPTSIKANKSKLTNDLYFYTPSSSGYTVAYDVNGEVRWYLTNYALWKIDRLQNGHLLVSTERLINNPYYMTGLYEIDLLGKIYTEFSLEGGYHHDYYEMENGNLLVASDDFNNKDGTVEDYIVELDRTTGKIIKTFDLKKVLNMEDGQSENYTSYDWFHNNSVWYDKKTDSITLSGRHQDAVINISYQTGELNWIIGDSTNWSSEYQKYFFTPVGNNFEWQWSQHAAMITPEGYVFLFDNGNNKSKNKDEYVDASNSYSRGVMYKIDTENMTIEQIFEYGKEKGSSFYSPYISDVDYLDKNHYIIHSGGIVYVDGKNSNQPAGFSKGAKLVSDTVELLNNEVIFEIILPTNNYRVEKMSLYSESENFTLGKANRLGSLGKTDVTKKKVGPIINSKKIDDEYSKYNIELSKEVDRLVVTGTFQKSDKVNIILYQNLISNYYYTRISKKPYTALCVDLNTEEDSNGLRITKYINQEGLKGKYSIYLEINGNLYNTNSFVEF